MFRAKWKAFRAISLIFIVTFLTELLILFIICFKIKNPPTVHCTSKIQPTTSPTFVFSVSASVRKKWGYERKLLDSRFGDRPSTELRPQNT
jgi:hypothetical protein